MSSSQDEQASGASQASGAEIQLWIILFLTSGISSRPIKTQSSICLIRAERARGKEDLERLNHQTICLQDLALHYILLTMSIKTNSVTNTFYFGRLVPPTVITSPAKLLPL